MIKNRFLGMAMGSWTRPDHPRPRKNMENGQKTQKIPKHRKFEVGGTRPEANFNMVSIALVECPFVARQSPHPWMALGLALAGHWPHPGWLLALAWPLAWPLAGPWLALGWPLAGPWSGPWLALCMALGWPVAWPLAGPYFLCFSRFCIFLDFKSRN